eukprot:CAMPEP_0179008642 /NCGR_PEP_ID=MMETSP0795-20121207/15831_1 /TAXON_ID=88552 /ORGANISM="Amoebophrya sp., Strain Ameob2" /LENGTH=1198 /DNA_ID=CAMNT_0020703753 /DNA_START=1528 /DNA_END=5124 /DNA_ORIENTATION=-
MSEEQPPKAAADEGAVAVEAGEVSGTQVMSSSRGLEEAEAEPQPPVEDDEESEEEVFQMPAGWVAPAVGAQAVGAAEDTEQEDTEDEKDEEAAAGGGDRDQVESGTAAAAAAAPPPAPAPTTTSSSSAAAASTTSTAGPVVASGPASPPGTQILNLPPGFVVPAGHTLALLPDGQLGLVPAAGVSGGDQAGAAASINDKASLSVSVRPPSAPTITGAEGTSTTATTTVEVETDRRNVVADEDSAAAAKTANQEPETESAGQLGNQKAEQAPEDAAAGPIIAAEHRMVEACAADDHPSPDELDDEDSDEDEDDGDGSLAGQGSNNGGSGAGGNNAALVLSEDDAGALDVSLRLLTQFPRRALDHTTWPPPLLKCAKVLRPNPFDDPRAEKMMTRTKWRRGTPGGQKASNFSLVEVHKKLWEEGVREIPATDKGETLVTKVLQKHPVVYFLRKQDQSLQDKLKLLMSLLQEEGKKLYQPKQLISAMWVTLKPEEQAHVTKNLPDLAKYANVMKRPREDDGGGPNPKRGRGTPQQQPLVKGGKVTQPVPPLGGFTTSAGAASGSTKAKMPTPPSAVTAPPLQTRMPIIPPQKQQVPVPTVAGGATKMPLPPPAVGGHQQLHGAPATASSTTPASGRGGTSSMTPNSTAMAPLSSVQNLQRTGTTPSSTNQQQGGSSSSTAATASGKNINTNSASFVVSDDAVTTLRVSNLPVGVKAKELGVLFQNYSVLGVNIKKSKKGDRYVGFVRVANRGQAKLAIDAKPPMEFKELVLKLSIDEEQTRTAQINLLAPEGGATKSSPGAGVERISLAAPADAASAREKLEKEVWVPRVSYEGGVMGVQMSRLKLDYGQLMQWCAWVPKVLTELEKHHKGRLTNVHLDFSHNQINDQGLSLLLEIFRKHHVHIADLSLGHNLLTDQAMRSLGEYIGRTQLPMRSLELEGNRFTHKGILYLARKVKNAPSNAYPRFDPASLKYASFRLAVRGNEGLETNELFASFASNDVSHCQTEQEAKAKTLSACPLFYLPGLNTNTDQSLGAPAIGGSAARPGVDEEVQNALGPAMMATVFGGSRAADPAGVFPPSAGKPSMPSHVGQHQNQMAAAAWSSGQHSKGGVAPGPYHPGYHNPYAVSGAQQGLPAAAAPTHSYHGGAGVAPSHGWVGGYHGAVGNQMNGAGGGKKGAYGSAKGRQHHHPGTTGKGLLGKKY